MLQIKAHISIYIIVVTQINKTILLQSKLISRYIYLTS